MIPPRIKGDPVTIIAVPKILRDKLTDAGADTLVQIIDKVKERSQLAVLELAEERFEKRIAQMDSKIELTRANIIQWMFIFWVGQVGTMTAILFAFFEY